MLWAMTSRPPANAILTFCCWTTGAFLWWCWKRKPEELSPDYLCRIIQFARIQFVLAATAKGVAQKGVYLGDLRALEIPIPPLEIQNQIVAEIEGYQKTIEEHRKAIRELEERSKEVINKVWGE